MAKRTTKVQARMALRTEVDRLMNDKPAAHPLDIPDFLRREKNAPARDEAAVQALCARAAVLRQPDLDDEEHDPRLVDMARRGLISRSVLRDPSSIAIALAEVTTREQRRDERLAALKARQDDAEAPKRAARPVDHISAGDIASTLEIDAKLVRRALRALKLEKLAGGWHFPQADVPALTKKIKAWLKAQEKKS